MSSDLRDRLEAALGNKTVYGVAVDSLGRLLIGSAAIGGRRRVLVYAEDPLAQVYRYGFAMHGGRFYVPVVERKEDVWVGEVDTSQRLLASAYG